jgi:hypothetical protein
MFEVFNVWTGQVVVICSSEATALRTAVRMGGSYDYDAIAGRKYVAKGNVK